MGGINRWFQPHQQFYGIGIWLVTDRIDFKAKEFQRDEPELTLGCFDGDILLDQPSEYEFQPWIMFCPADTENNNVTLVGQ